MIREECIALLNRYANYNGVGIPNLELCKESMKMAADLLSNPSLPSNLDEAAEKYSENILANNEDLQDAIEDAYKAGAEWMAGQGDTVEGVFKAGDPGYPDVRMGEQYSIEHFLCKPGGIEPGDEVIVQIRKKQ